MLTSSGSQCRTAADGLEALALLDSGEDFELLLTNLMMPNSDGLGLLTRTKEKFPDPTVQISRSGFPKRDSPVASSHGESEVTAPPKLGRIPLVYCGSMRPLM
jgi:CheY-like chemotaxis protein